MVMKEFELIERLTAGLPAHPAVLTGAGDDCAVLDLGAPDALTLFKTDAVVEGIHFTADCPPEKIGFKALARCLSDLAAMGGTPVAALVTLGLKRDFDPAFVEAIYSGMNALATRVGMAIAGGGDHNEPGTAADLHFHDRLCAARHAGAALRRQTGGCDLCDR